MPARVNTNWTRELAAGNTDVTPSISASLYQEITEVTVVDAVECVLAGDFLKKWRRGQPLTPKTRSNGEDTKVKGCCQLKDLVLIPAGRPHERFFWVSRICGTYFLRWQSRRKRSNESAFALCQLNSIRRGDEVDVFDSKNKNDDAEKLVFVLSGTVSLRLAASDPHAARLWIAGIYHIARHACDEYARAWITNSSKLAALFSPEDADGIPSFKSRTIAQELEREENTLSKLLSEAKSRDVAKEQVPVGVGGVIQMLMEHDLIRRADRVEPIISAVKEVLATRESWLHKLIQRLNDAEFSSVDNLVRFVADCAYHLRSMDVNCDVLRYDVFVLDKIMELEDCIRLIFDVVKHYSITVDVGNQDESVHNILPRGVTIKGVEEPDISQSEGMVQLPDIEDTKGTKSGDVKRATNLGNHSGFFGRRRNVNPLQPIDNQLYQKFLETVQGANRLETAEQFIEALNNAGEMPLATQKTKQKYGVGLCLRKSQKVQIPIKVLTIMGFHWSLAQRFNTAVMPHDAAEIANMLKYPLNSFWIASSHNTYLTGNQVGGAATAGALADALLRGCRCIELDCQDGPNGEPVLCHSWKNYQLTGSVTLREALIACRETAFRSSKLPVILSMQMPCTDECKMRTAEMCKQILGHELYIPDPANPVDYVASIPIGSLLSKFIIKGKIRTEGTAKNGAAEKVWMSVVALHGYRLKEMTLEDIKRVRRGNVYSLKESKFSKVASHKKFLRKLTDIAMVRVFPSGTRLASTNFCPLNAWAAGIQFVALNYQSCDRSMLINYGKFNQSFGYVLKPPELRPVTFSNQECLDYFCRGPITLKIHVLSASQLSPPNEGLEQTNFGNALDNILYSMQQGGVVLDLDEVVRKMGKPRKPHPPNSRERKELKLAIEEGLKVDTEDNITTLSNVFERSASIISTQCDTCCPFVEIALAGEGERIQRTEIVNFNGFNPVWADSTPPFEFYVEKPNLAILLLTVKHYDNVGAQLIGQTALPVNRMRPGIRWAQLLDQRFMEIDCCGLLLHIDIAYAE